MTSTTVLALDQLTPQHAEALGEVLEDVRVKLRHAETLLAGATASGDTATARISAQDAEAYRLAHEAIAAALKGLEVSR